MKKLSNALNGFEQQLYIAILEKKNIDGYLKEFIKQSFMIKAVLQPLQADKVIRKTEYNIGFTTYSLITRAKFKLNYDDLVYIGPKKYRVTGIAKWGPWGYNYFELVEDFVKTTSDNENIIGNNSLDNGFDREFLF